MKKISMALAVLFCAALIIGCGADTAELAFKNGENGSTVNNIVWEKENKSWDNGPYNYNAVTESKEVSELNSEVTALWDGDPEINRVLVYFPQTNSNSLSLSPGESYEYSLVKNN